MDRHTQQLTLGIFFLAVAVFEIVIGTAVGARKYTGFRLVRKKDGPGQFWFAVALMTLLGVIGIGLGMYS